MRIDVISSREELEGLRENWDKLYRADPDAQYFLSWRFMSAFLHRFEGRWFVLAARPGSQPSPYVALMPFRMRTRMNAKADFFFNEVYMGGSYVADYTGAVCAPEFAQAAMAAFARQLRKMPWAKLHLENLRMSGGRLRSFIENLEDERLTIRDLSRINKEDNVDNSRCPSVELPDTWDAYLEQKVSSNMRQKLRRLLRKLDGSDEFRITLSDSSTIKRDIEILLGFWQARWGAQKGERLAGILRTNRLTFKEAFAQGSLFFPVLWHREQPLGALATFIDPVKKTYLFNMAGRDESTDILPPGLVLHAYSIRHAIENGFRVYDFLRGDEPYKYSFGGTDTLLRIKIARTRSGRNLNDRLDVRSLTSVFRQSEKYHKAGQLTKAENGYRQILDTDPEHAKALYALGQLLAGKGDHWAAAATFEKLCRVAPDLAKGWVRLGNALQMVNRHAEAIDAFGRVIGMMPELAAAHYSMGVSLLQVGENAKAISALNEVLRLGSGNPKDAPLRVKATVLLGKLRQPGLPPLPALQAKKPAAPSLLHSAAVLDQAHRGPATRLTLPTNGR